MISRKLTYANVVSTLALLVAVAGGSTAIAISAKKNSVTTKSIKKGNVTATDLAGIEVIQSPLQAGAVTASCPAGKRLIGGGGRGVPLPNDTPVALQSSYPDGNGWVVQKSFGGNAIAYALCLKTKPGK